MKTKTNTRHLLFLIAYILCMLDAMLINLSNFGKLPYSGYISWAFRGGAVLFIALKLVLDRRYTASSLIYAACAGLLLLISSVISDSVHVLYLALIVLGMHRISPRAVVRIDFFLRIALIAFILISCFAGLIENRVLYRSADNTRYSLGFIHPNTIAALALVLVLEDAWLRRRTFSLLYAAVLALLGAALYVITISRTSVLLIVLFPFLLLAFRVKNPKPVSRPAALCAEWGYLFFLLLSVVTMLLCSSSMVFGLLDQLMSGRFSNCAALYSRYPLPLLGQKVIMGLVVFTGQNHATYAPLDVAYLRVMLESGLLVTVLYAVLHMTAVRKAVRTQDRWTLLVLVTFLLYGFSESTYNNIYINFSLLFGAGAVYDALESRHPRLRRKRRQANRL